MGIVCVFMHVYVVHIHICIHTCEFTQVNESVAQSHLAAFFRAKKQAGNNVKIENDTALQALGIRRYIHTLRLYPCVFICVCVYVCVRMCVRENVCLNVYGGVFVYEGMKVCTYMDECPRIMR